MAKRKKDVIVEVVREHIIHVWCDQPARWLTEIAQIEGIASVELLVSAISVWTDPRYDAEEIASEIEELLTAEVPEVFKQ